ncbi:phosphoribosyltransferase [Synechococcales cyanobacterium C]|uniref:Phosphoribosyltransferase n=1 Tax=Petrachloros mirabilis ULC683 TaxID=2781853 RepID=A0A8K2A918_9CYAN|nr:phosphoribosyltransferase [Petrachloros mirabilis]NCJ07779.1 phosphoribosyltransferase [Petrachloros mirabilis ULC683]
MVDLFVSWRDYHRCIEQLAANLYQSGWQFNQIICLARGGLRVGDLLARIYDLPLAILATSSYGGSNGQVRGSLTFGQDLTMTTPNLGDRILLVDDLVDSGITLEKTLIWLDRRYGSCISEVRTAVLWYKACSVIKPDYYVDYLPNNPWIHQPFEIYEQTSPAELAAKVMGQTSGLGAQEGH